MDILNQPQALYETDEHQWMLEQIELLRAKKYELVDHGNLIQYLTEMTIRDRRELENRFVVLLQHMLKFAVQPDHGSRSWVGTIVEQQRQIESMLKGTPSLKSYAQQLFADAYPHAVRAAAIETGIPRANFPAQNPWSMDDVRAYEPPDVS
jgi:hypothetical protein